MTRPGPPATRPCGTVSAYKRHLRNDQTPCPECKAAWAEWHRNNYHRTHNLSTPKRG